MLSFVGNVEHRLASSPKDKLLIAAGRSFLESMRTNGYHEVDKDALKMWIVDMTFSELKPTTRKRYFARINSIYNQWKSTSGENPFEDVKDVVDVDFQLGSRESNRSLQLVSRNLSVNEVYYNLFLYLCFNPSASITDAIALRFEDTIIDIPQIDNIIEKQKETAHRSSYVFPLGQGKKREPQIIRETLAALKGICDSLGLHIEGEFSRESITSIWIAAAIQANIPLLKVRALIKAVPPEYSALCLVPIADLPDTERVRVIKTVAAVIYDNPPQWFVMKMRAGQNPDTIRERILNNAPELYPSILFYYPTHKVVKQMAKGKNVKVEVPYLPAVLFFKTEYSKIATLMSRIGDLAWCYKYSNTVGSKYCTISHAEMKAFQRYIGEFTPDIAMELELRQTPLREGTVVRINGGGRMVGAEAVVESVKNQNGTRTYTLNLTSYLQARWTIKDMEEIYLEPVGI